MEAMDERAIKPPSPAKSREAVTEWWGSPPRGGIGGSSGGMEGWVRNQAKSTAVVH